VSAFLTRRSFLSLSATLAAACTPPSGPGQPPIADGKPSEPGRFTARVQPPSSPAPPTGESPLGLGVARDGLIYLPRPSGEGPLPLLVLLHGAGGTARRVTTRTNAFQFAEEFGVVVIAAESRGVTWDVVRGSLGPDIEFIDAALRHMFARVRIDASRLALGGVSDGASYALSIGLGNGDLFSHVIAFSPGFINVRRAVGNPAIFISHGTSDDILPIETTSRRFVPKLKEGGYDVHYREFAGGHMVPPDVSREAFEWFRGKPKRR
jgi:phospholipase/carboxylesterase